MSDYLKGSFTGEEEAWLLWFGITAVTADKLMDSSPSFFFLIDFDIFFLLYNIVLVLPYINMNLPRVYTCSPS